MAFDLDQLRLDIPSDSFGPAAGVRPFWRGAALVLLAACVILAAWSLLRPPASADSISVPIHVVAPLSQADVTAFTAGGWVEPASPCPTVVSSMVDGRLEKLCVVEGDYLLAGDEIAILQSQPYRDAQSRAQARVATAKAEAEALQAVVTRLHAGNRPEEIAVVEADLRTAEARLALLEAGYRVEDIAQAEAELDAARARCTYLALQADRTEALALEQTATHALAQRDRAAADEAKADVRGREAVLARLRAGSRPEEIGHGRAEVQAAQARLKLLQAGARAEEIAEAEADLEAGKSMLREAEAELAAAQRLVEYCIVTAPHDGVVLDILAPQGSWLHGEKHSIARLYDPEHMQVRLDVRQDNASSLAVGQLCSVKIESRKGKPYSGRVVRIDPQGNLARDTVRVHVRLDEPDNMLRIDLTVSVDFLAREATKGEAPLVVPAAAVTKRDGVSCVFVVRGGMAHLAVVELGEETAGGVTVLSGLAAGEIVATGSLALLAEGTPVRLQEDTP